MALVEPAATGEWVGDRVGVAQDGVSSAMLESAIGAAVHGVVPFGATGAIVDLSVSYVRVVPSDGRTLRAEARVVRAGRRLVTAEGRIFDDRERLVATATATYSIRRGRSQ